MRTQHCVMPKKAMFLGSAYISTPKPDQCDFLTKQHTYAQTHCHVLIHE